MPKLPTCNTYEPGSTFIDKKGRWVDVPETHFGLRCNIVDCEWYLLYPIRFGRDMIEALRRKHIESVHFTDLTNHRCQISEAELNFVT